LIQSKYKHPNGNVFLWLGSGSGIEKNLDIDNVLILDGGEVLLLKSVMSIPLYNQDVISDFRNEESSILAEKYGIPITRGFIEELKNGVANDAYPPFKQPLNDRFTTFKNMISMYIQHLKNLRSIDDATKHLEDVIDMCHKEIQDLRRNP